MRRRYSGKRSLRRKLRGSKRYRKSKKSIIRDIDHSGKGLQFARAIAKGISRKAYDSCVCVQTNHINPDGFILPGNPPQINAANMVPFGRVFELQSSNTLDQSNFCATSCMNGFGSRDNEFQRHANMYLQYRIKAIRFEFVPTTAVTGRESILPCTAGVPSTTTDDVLQAMDANQTISSTYWLIKWPHRGTGQFMDFGLNLTANTTYPRNDSALIDPSVIKIPITEKLVLTWKPKILGYKTNIWVPLNTSTGYGSNAPQPTYEPKAKPYSFMNIVSNYHPSTGQLATNYVPDVEIPNVTVGTGPGQEYNTNNLRISMTQPLLSVYDSLLDQYLGPNQWPITGRWTMHTVFEFRHKRDRAATSNILVTENTPLVTYATDGGASNNFTRD